MRNIVIIGNGFDLAHNLPTSYGQFIDSLILSEFNKEKSNLLTPFVLKSIAEIAGKGSNGAKVDYTSIDGKPHSFNTHNYFLADLLKNKIKEEGNWSDIEGFYFEKLKALENNNDLNKLQEDFEDIKQRLIKYLKSINVKAIPDNNIKHFFGHNYFKNTNSENNLILNFNYTDTLEKLYLNELSSFTINHVHGELSSLLENEIVFGHDISRQRYDDYLESGKQDEFFTNIKFMKYRLNSSLEDLNFFLNEFKPFNVFIIGHSCSISDNQMLETILSDSELNQVSIFYYKEPKYYESLRRNIDKIMLGTGINIDTKIKSIPYQIPTPQFSDDDLIKKSVKKKIEVLFSQKWFIKSPYASDIR